MLTSFHLKFLVTVHAITCTILNTLMKEIIWNLLVRSLEQLIFLKEFNLIFNLCFYNEFSFSVFIYSMPGYSCSIKERMMYSSCKAPLLSDIEQNIGLVVTKKVTKI